MIDVKKTVELLNPYGIPIKAMNWAGIVVWCLQNVPSMKRKNWIERARRAFRREDGFVLHKMIIGS